MNQGSEVRMPEVALEAVCRWLEGEQKNLHVKPVLAVKRVVIKRLESGCLVYRLTHPWKEAVSRKNRSFSNLRSP